jgi:DNA-binding GntR family transcriptional regulator
LRADEQAAIKIREYIQTPEAREWIMIPVMELVKKLGYSHRTVCDALRMLVKEGAVERYGRYYAIAREAEGGGKIII